MVSWTAIRGAGAKGSAEKKQVSAPFISQTALARFLYRWIAYGHMRLGLKEPRSSGAGVLLWNHGPFIL